MVHDDYSPGQFLPGTVYRVVRPLGRGGAGRVYEVEDSTVGKRYALKTIADPRVDVRSLADRLMRESQILASVADSRVVGVYTGGVTTDGHCFYVMEMLDGEPLGTSLRHNGKLDLSVVLSVGIEIGEALVSLHGAGFVHRDVKPDNIFVSFGAPGGTSAKLLLGLAVANAMDDPGPKSGSIYGSFGYASPEQLRGEPAAASMDIWSLGCVLYHAISGRLPFEVSSDWRTYVDGVLGASPAPHVSDVSPEAPADLVALLARMLRKESSRRLPRAEMVSATLRRVGVRRSTRPPPAPVDLDPADQTVPGTSAQPVATDQQPATPHAPIGSAKVADRAARSPMILNLAPAEDAEETATLRVRPQQITIQDLVDPADVTPVLLNLAPAESTEDTVTIRVRPQQITIQDLVDPADVTPVLLNLAPAESTEDTATIRVRPQPAAPPAVAVRAGPAPVGHHAAPADGEHPAQTVSVRLLQRSGADATDPDLTPVRLHAADDADETETRRQPSGQTAAASPSELVHPNLTPVQLHTDDDDETVMQRLPFAEVVPRNSPEAARLVPVRLHPGADDDDTETLRLLSAHIAPASPGNAVPPPEERPSRRQLVPDGSRPETFEAQGDVVATSPLEDSDAELTTHGPVVFDEVADSPQDQGTIPEQPAIVGVAAPSARTTQRDAMVPANVAAILEGPIDPELVAPIPFRGDAAVAPTEGARVGVARAVERVAEEPPHAARLFASAPVPHDALSPEHRLALSPHIAGPISRPPAPGPSERPQRAPEHSPFQNRFSLAPEHSPLQNRVSLTPERSPSKSRVSTAPERSPFQSRVSTAPERNPFQSRVSTVPERNPFPSRLRTAPERNPFQTLSQRAPERAPLRRFDGPTAQPSQGLGSYGDPKPDRPPRPTFYSLPARAPRLTYALLLFSVLIAWVTVGLVFLHFVGVRKRSHFQ